MDGYHYFKSLHRRRWLVLVLLLGVSLSLWQCSDRVVESEPVSGVQLGFKLANAEQAQLIDSVRVIVYPSDGSDSIVVTLPLIDGQYEGRIEGIPLGEARVVTLAYDAGGHLIYRGETTVIVSPGDPTETDVVYLYPVAPLIRLTPRQIEISGGDKFALEVEAFNIENLAQAGFTVRYAETLMQPDSSRAGCSVDGSQCWQIEAGLALDSISYLMEVRSSSSQLADDTGYAQLATIYFSSFNPDQVPVADTVQIELTSLLGSSPDSGSQLFPIDLRSVYLDPALIVFTAVGIDTIPPQPIYDFGIDSTGQDAAYLSWIATGDDRKIGRASQYDLRYLGRPVTVQNWDAATVVASLPSPKAAGGHETFVAPFEGLSDSVYFGIRAADDVGNWSRVISKGALILDTIAPATVNDLQVTDQTLSAVTLGWTAVGDDGTAGQASLYDLRWYLTPLTTSNWDSAVPITAVPLPQASGAGETVTTDLDGTIRHYFGVMVADEVGNWSEISNVVSSTPFDTIAPTAVSDLQVLTTSGTSVALTWTATGDDGLVGTAAAYDLRYATTPITAANFSQANAVAGLPLPSATGAEETFTVTGLTEQTPYYFAIKVVDEAGNRSNVSNVIAATTNDITPPGPVTDLEWVDYRYDHVILHWTAPGDDGLTGTSSSYDMRWSNSPINDANFAGATPIISPPVPDPAGTEEVFTFHQVLNDFTYYIALKTRDEEGNLSPMSNVVVFHPVRTTFADARLESEVRGIINLPTGLIFEPDLFPVESLELTEWGVSSIEGLQYCHNLRYLGLDYNNVTDLGPLEGLMNLEHLALSGNNITDIGPLSGLTGLNYLELSGNTISDLSPIAGLSDLDTLIARWAALYSFQGIEGMTSLTYLDLYNTMDSGAADPDLSPLASLAQLKWLRIDYDRVADLSPLEGLVNLDTVYANANDIADMSPLSNNPGFQAGDLIYVCYNYSLSDDSYGIYIPALQERGVTVWYSCEGKSAGHVRPGY
ncbi:MAG: leucine-rich repeat domain-containing protein [bacterium]